MNSIDFLKTIKRYMDCNNYENFDWTIQMTPEELVSRMEKWAAEHPIKTRQSELLKLFPNANCDERGVLLCDPCDFYDSMLDDCHSSCADCRRAFWLEEIEE